MSETDLLLAETTRLFERIAGEGTIDRWQSEEIVRQVIREDLEDRPIPFGGNWRNPVESLAEHGLAVSRLAVRCLRRRGWGPGAIFSAGVAGLLHDVGMLGVPSALLAKQGPLSPGEAAIMRGHVAAGTELLEEAGWCPEVVRQAAADHHEREDGSGYPRGKLGCELGEWVQCLGLLDAYAARVSDRPHRPAQLPRRALGELGGATASGQFDPQAFRLLQQVVGRS